MIHLIGVVTYDIYPISTWLFEPIVHNLIPYKFIRMDNRPIPRNTKDFF